MRYSIHTLGRLGVFPWGPAEPVLTESVNRDWLSSLQPRIGPKTHAEALAAQKVIAACDERARSWIQEGELRRQFLEGLRHEI
jgi:hypothetical protein